MTDPTTRENLTRLVDELSQWFCITPYSDRIGSELRKLWMDKLDELEGLEDFLRSPIELMKKSLIQPYLWAQINCNENSADSYH
ncbi:hypothetical protein [Acinetobacter baylyi]|nr:hypothetical protein [Acinetobacter baylyi]